MSMNLVTLLYLLASVCFIQALKGLSHPTTSIRGNLFGMIGMAVAVFTTAALIVNPRRQSSGHGLVLLGLLAGGSAGAIGAKRVEMTKMPELVAFYAQHDWSGCGVHCYCCGHRTTFSDRRQIGRWHASPHPCRQPV